MTMIIRDITPKAPRKIQLDLDQEDFLILRLAVENYCDYSTGSRSKEILTALNSIKIEK